MWEKLLAAEGLGDIDESIATDETVEHAGVGRVAETAIRGTEADRADLDEDLRDPAVDVDTVLDIEQRR